MLVHLAAPIPKVDPTAGPNAAAKLFDEYTVPHDAPVSNWFHPPACAPARSDHAAPPPRELLSHVSRAGRLIDFANELREVVPRIVGHRRFKRIMQQLHRVRPTSHARPPTPPLPLLPRVSTAAASASCPSQHKPDKATSPSSAAHFCLCPFEYGFLDAALECSLSMGCEPVVDCLDGYLWLIFGFPDNVTQVSRCRRPHHR